MKKCILMFVLLITALLTAVFMESKKDSYFEPKLVVGEDKIQNMMVEIDRQDSIRGSFE